MLSRLGAFTVRRRKWVLVGSLVFFVGAGVVGGKVAEHLSSGGFDDPNSEAFRAAQILEDRFESGSPNLLLLIEAKRGTVDHASVAARGTEITKDLSSEPAVLGAVSYWSLGSPPPLRSEDATQALVLAQIRGTQDEMIDVAEKLVDEYTFEDATVVVRVGGQGPVFAEVGETIEADLRRAELITFPVVLLLLVLVFGSVIAAGLPLAVGALAVVGTFVVLQGIAALTEVSIYSLNLTTGMGLGLGIDYSLFIVSRFREEMRNGLDVDAAVIRTVETAGRTIVFSALTVAISLAALLVFPLSFLRSFAYAGTGVVALASLGAVVFLPAVLATLGTRVDKWVLWHREPKPVGEGFWHNVAMFVMRRPLPIATAVIAILLLLGAPFLGVNFGLPDDRVLPPSAETRSVHDELRTNFASSEAAALPVVAPDIEDLDSLEADVHGYARLLSAVSGVARVDAVTGSYIEGQRVVQGSPLEARFASDEGTWLSVVPAVEPLSPEGERLVADVREVPAPFDVMVGGPSADLVDSKASLFSRLPLAGAIIGIVSFVVLFLMFGSLLVPVKAVVLNILSLTATFGAMVWIFQEGHLSGLLDFTPTGALDTTSPILMFCVAFGLSMDYEVFLLSRIKEEHDKSGDNVASVAIGLERTGRLVTAAAALIAVVFIAFSTSDITFIKLFGVGLALAVVMDATLIRATLVPAFMRLAGEANWWAPRSLKRIHERFGIGETAPSRRLDQLVADPATPGSRSA